MPRRVTPAQMRSKLRQAEAKQRQAINRHNAAVRKANRAINRYNQEVRAHNARVRSNQARLRRELQRLNNRPRSTTTSRRHVVVRTSVQTVQRSFVRLESAANSPTWQGDDELFDLSEGEAANSAAVLNALFGPTGDQGNDDGSQLRTTTITDELALLDPDLDSRWRGALFALHPSNPDASRHFCTSAREMLDQMLLSAAPDREVLAADPNAPLTPRGSVSRRARVVHCLRRRGTYDAALAEFIDADIDDVVTLFREFNTGTHGSAGRFDIPQLQAMKRRVEDAIRFVSRASVPQ